MSHLYSQLLDLCHLRGLTILALSLLLSGLLTLIGGDVAAQEDDYWQGPINLSNSGAATQPRLIIDAADKAHVLWREDAVNQIYYRRQADGDWMPAAAVELPFATNAYVLEEMVNEGRVIEDANEVPATLYNPELVADGNGRVHAFWLDEKARLFHSSVPFNEIDNFEAWSRRQLVGEGVLDFSADSDGRNNIHISFIAGADSPGAATGIYYRQLPAGGAAWLDPRPIYLSAYYRTATSNDLNIRLIAGNSAESASNVYLVMDNRPLEEVLFARSLDGGSTWSQATVIDRRGEGDLAESFGPSMIDIATNGEALLLSWMAGHDSICQSYYQLSNDRGSSWQPASVVENSSEDCPNYNRLLAGQDGLIYLLSHASDGVYLQAWNGEEWSSRERQATLSGFGDPITYRPVVLDNQHSVIDEDGSLVVISSGISGENSDVWLLERPLGDEADWFPEEPSVWSEPALLMADSRQIADPLLLPGNDNLLHAFWIVEGDNAQIYYSSWSEETWSRQVPLLQLDSIHVDQLSGVYDLNNGPFLMWRDEDTNTFYYSTVMGERILLPAEWSVPKQVFENDVLTSSPSLSIDKEGVINIAYAMPLNEDRGIRIIRSSDFGQQWSQAMKVVDAVDEGWQMVDRPSLVATDNGDLHVVFTTYALRPEPVAEALYYTYSADEGETWSDPELVAEGMIGWSQIASAGEGSVLINWQQQYADQRQLWSQQVSEGQINRESLTQIVDTGVGSYIYSLITQLPDQPYVVQVWAEDNGEFMMRERRWSDGGWRAIETNSLQDRLDGEELVDLDAAIAEDGQLLAIFNTAVDDGAQKSGNEARFAVVRSLEGGTAASSTEATTASASELFFSHRSIEVPQPLPSNGVQSEVAATAVPTAAAASQAEDLPDLADDEISNNPVVGISNVARSSQPTSVVSAVVMGVLPVALITLLVIAVVLIRLRPKR